jgi:hypothetical protein
MGGSVGEPIPRRPPAWRLFLRTNALVRVGLLGAARLSRRVRAEWWLQAAAVGVTGVDGGVVVLGCVATFGLPDMPASASTPDLSVPGAGAR